MKPAIKLGIIGMILIGLAVALYFAFEEYKKQCPEGLMVCLGLEDPETVPAGEEEEDPSPTSNTVPSVDRSPEYSECTQHFSEEDKTKTCYDPANGKGGLRWFWANTTGGKACLDKTKFYKIEASTAANDHAMKYEYVQPGGTTNGFIFTNAKHITRKNGIDMNMKFNITPLDKDKKVLADPLMGQELNPGGSVTTDCTSIGTEPKDFMKVFNIQSVPAESPPPPPPQDCEGTMSSNWGPCVSDTPNPICNVSWGTSKKSFIKSKDSKYGGKACPGTESKKCVVTENCTPYDEADLSSLNLPACTYGDWITPDNQPVCPVGCANDDTVDSLWGPMIKQQRFIQDVILDLDGKLKCNPQMAVDREIRACETGSNPGARSRCPIDCVGAWTSYIETPANICLNSSRKKEKLTKKERTWVVTTPASHGGTCPFANGTVETSYTHNTYIRNGCGAGAAQSCPASVAPACSDYVTTYS